jgi:carbonic anhydrase/acetyltransferase-like protein (isoleucine patch superfamily)
MIQPSVKIFKGARIIGRVEIDHMSSVWFNTVLRGDIEPLVIGKYSNIQDSCVLHSSRNFPLKIGSYVSVGHAAVLHGATVQDNCLIGMNSTVLNGALIRKNSVVGAGAVVTEGKEFPERSLILGVPAKALGKLEDDAVTSIKENALRYAEMAKSGKDD